LEVGVRSGGREHRSQLLGGRSEDSVRKRELNLRVVELDGRHSLAVLGGNSGGSDDLDRFVAGSVATSHIVVQIVDGRVQVGVTVLSVHIVSSTSGVVFDPDAEVLHVAVVLLSDLLEEIVLQTIVRNKTVGFKIPH
jgi:hypothetical protein